MNPESSITLDRRSFIKVTTIAGVGVLVVDSAGCGPSKEKAVKYVGLVIDLAKEASPLLNLLGVPQIAEIVDTKAIPALEKLKEALAKVDVPAGMSALATVRSALSGIGKAVENLPVSARRTTIVGILASVNVLLLTVESFVDSEMQPTTKTVMVSAERESSMTQSINKAYEATKP